MTILHQDVLANLHLILIYYQLIYDYLVLVYNKLSTLTHMQKPIDIKVAQPPYGREVVYLPGNINRLARKLHLLPARVLCR